MLKDSSIQPNRQTKRSVSITLLFAKSGRTEIFSVIICILALFSFVNTRNLNLNVYLRDETGSQYLTQQSLITSLTSRYSTSSNLLERQSYESPTYTRRYPRVLAGIFSGDLIDDSRYRYVFRELLQSHPKVCRLSDFINNDRTRNGPCELIYTFVLGGNNQSDAPTQIVSNASGIPILNPEIPKSKFSNDFHEGDLTFLNIKENMNDGKSPTWFYYASMILDTYRIEYVMKIDTDSLIYLDRYFDFVESSLPPAPYNTRILAGAPVDKAWWNLDKDQERSKETYFREQYQTMHLYAAGQMYIMSHDLVDGVVHVAANDKNSTLFAEGHEDHDVSTMAFLSLRHDKKDRPLKFVILPYDDPFWKHPLKLKHGVSNWKKDWEEETKRIKTLSNHSNIVSSDTLKIQITAPIDFSPTPTVSKLPELDKGTRLNWIKHLESGGISGILEEIKVLDSVQINNTIAPEQACFLKSGYLDHPIQVVQLTAPTYGGRFHEELAAFLKKRIDYGIDVIILSEMDVDMSRSANVHTVQKIAESLQMNYAYGIESVRLNEQKVVNEHGFTGQAILSKCPMYDPYLVREFHEENSMKTWKMISSNTAVFVRMATADTITSGNGNHIVVGSVSKIDPWTNRHYMWKYQYGYWPNELIMGIAPKNQLGSIIAGNFERSMCKQFGLRNLDAPSKNPTYPANCREQQFGITRNDNFCSNLMLYGGTLHKKRVQRQDRSYLPCYKPENYPRAIQLSDHSVIAVLVH